MLIYLLHAYITQRFLYLSYQISAPKVILISPFLCSSLHQCWSGRQQANYLIIDNYLRNHPPSGKPYLYFGTEWPPQESPYLTKNPLSIKTRNSIKQRGRISYSDASKCKRRHSAANDRGSRKLGRCVDPSPPLFPRLKGRADGGLFLFSSLINDFGKSSFEAKVFSFSKSEENRVC